MNHGRTYGGIFVRAACRAQTPCRTGRDWSAILASLHTAVLRTPIGFAAVNNPLRILQTLDRHLTRRAEITLFGARHWRSDSRAALPSLPGVMTWTRFFPCPGWRLKMRTWISGRRK